MKKRRNLISVRKRVVKKALNGMPVSKVAYSYMTSRTFVYKWLKRYKENPKGEWYKERSRAPKNPKRKVTEEIKEKILFLRRKLGLNIKKISAWFKRNNYKISHTTIQKVLVKAGEKIWNRSKKKYSRFKRFERPTPNDLWQIDIKDPFWDEPQGQHLYLLTMIDDHSRFLVGAKFYPRPVKYQDILSLLDQSIKKYTKPTQILTDNGAQFYAVRGGTSSFTRWTMQEGIKHIRSRVFHPQTCGKVERHHGIILKEMRRLNLSICNPDLNSFLDYFNYCRPHQGIDFKTPGERFMNTAPIDIIPKSVIDLT